MATYPWVLLIAAFYLLPSWVTVGALGAGTAASAAAEQTGLLMFNLVAKFSGKSVSDLMGVFVCTSLLATYLAIHNAASRYVFALSREKLLPVALGRLNRFAPSNASVAVTIATVVCVAAFGMTGVDPYQSGVPVLIGFGTLGIIFLQGFAAVAIVFYFGRRRRAKKPMVGAAPAVGRALAGLPTRLVAPTCPLLSTTPVPGLQLLSRT